MAPIRVFLLLKETVLSPKTKKTQAVSQWQNAHSSMRFAKHAPTDLGIPRYLRRHFSGAAPYQSFHALLHHSVGAGDSVKE
jgi:hypothetical protein